MAGIDADEIIDASPMLRATEEVARTHPEFTNLPRKYKTADQRLRLSVHRARDQRHLVRRRRPAPTARPGFDLWVGGGLSTNPMLAQRLGVFVEPDRVPDVWAGVTGVFRDYGYRRLRSRARLKFLVADWGAERFREVLEKEYLRRRAARRPGPGDRRRRAATTSACTGSGTGATTWASRRASGRTSRHPALAGRRPRRGVRVRPGAHHGPAEAAHPRRAGRPGRPSWREELAARDLLVTPSAFRRGTMACTGIEFCKLAIVETKQRAADLYAELERRLPGFDTPISINVNGCPNSCARFQVADIGLKGSIVDGGEGFQMHLGGSLGDRPGVRPQAARAEGDGGWAGRLRRAGPAQLPRRPGRRRAVRHLGPPRRRTAAGVSGHEGAEPAGERQVPFYCPYCGDEDLRPAGPTAGSWRCGACSRAFELRFAGVAPGGQDRVPAGGGGAPS